MNNIDYSIENALLGNVISFPNESRTILESLVEDDFVDPKNKIVFSAIKQIYNEFVSTHVADDFKLDTAILLDYLARGKKKSAAGGEAHIDYLIANAIGNANLDTYIHKIKNGTLVRKCLEAFDNFKSLYTKNNIDYSVFLGQVEKDITAITSQRETTIFTEIGEALDTMSIEYSKPSRTITTGYNELDMITGGFHPGSLCILAARTSVGKTALALNFVLNVVQKNRAVGFFSLEMDRKEIAMRLLQNRSKIDGKTIHKILQSKDNLSGEFASSRDRMRQAIGELKKMPIYIDDGGRQRLGDILTKSRQLKATVPSLGLIVVDYLSLIQPDVMSRDRNRQLEIAEISANLKALAKELQIPVLALSQLVRGVDQRKDHKPVLSDLRESGAIEQDADVILLLYRADYYRNEEENNKNSDPYEVASPADTEVSPISKVNMDIAKNRNGSVGNVQFEFDKPHCHFEVPDESMRNLLHDEDY